jgi:hypothetical protein
MRTIIPNAVAEPPCERSVSGEPDRYRSKIFRMAHTVAARPARAIDRVSGMLFGQTATQF